MMQIKSLNIKCAKWLHQLILFFFFFKKAKPAKTSVCVCVLTRATKVNVLHPKQTYMLSLSHHICSFVCNMHEMSSS